ncbi:MAG: hypothetical protein ACE5GW_01945 [Planctomycetota bacterium]
MSIAHRQGDARLAEVVLVGGQEALHLESLPATARLSRGDDGTGDSPSLPVRDPAADGAPGHQDDPPQVHGLPGRNADLLSVTRKAPSESLDLDPPRLHPGLDLEVDVPPPVAAGCHPRPVLPDHPQLRAGQGLAALLDDDGLERRGEAGLFLGRRRTPTGLFGRPIGSLDRIVIPG